MPYRVFGGVKFYDRREIKDALAYLRALVNPDDEVSWKRIVNTLRRGVGDTSVAKIDAYASGAGIPFPAAIEQATAAGVSGKALGRYICGKCFLLHYDSEYKEDDADFEACMPVRKAKPVEGIDVRELPGGRCVALLHKGPYNELGRSYAKILAFVKEKGYEVLLPTREVYLKGPGMIFKGNPKNYLTEIQMLVK